MNKKIVALVVSLMLMVGLALADAPNLYNSYKQNYGDRRWHVKLNALIDALSGDIESLRDSINYTQNYMVLMPVTPTYSSGTAFTLAGDYTSYFTAGKVVLVGQGTDGLATNTVDHSSYSYPNTTVTLTSSNLTSNLAQVWVAATRAGIFPSSLVGWIYGNDYGSPGQAALTAAIDAIGSSTRELLLSPGTWTVSSDTATESGTTLRVMPGAYLDVQNGVTLTINGPIEAGPYQIFSWTGTGTINISGSPTSKCFVQWWGGIGDDSTNNASAYLKAAAGIGNGQTLHFPTGVYRFSSGTTVSDKIRGFSMSGDGVTATKIRLNLDADTDGFTFGDGTGSRFALNISNLSFIGAANSNRIALRIRQTHIVRCTNVNFQTGSAEWACSVEGSLYVFWDNVTQHEHGFEALYGAKRAANVFRLITQEDEGTVDYQTNVCHLNVNIDGPTTGYGLYVSGISYSQSTINITGTIETVATPLYLHGIRNLRLYNLYQEGNTNPVIIDGCYYADIDTIKGYGQTIDIRSCKALSFRNFQVGRLIINALCRGVVVGPGQFTLNDGLQNYAPDTQVVGAVTSEGVGSYVLALSQGIDKQNIIPSLLNRWMATGPADWNTGAWTNTKCGVGQVDTTCHSSLYSWLITTGGSTAYPNYSLSTEQLSQLRGKFANFSVWAKMNSLDAGGSAQTFANYPFIRLTVQVPDWTASTPYKMGDGARTTLSPTYYQTNYFWRAINNGTSSGTQPRWGKSATGATNIGSNVISSFSDTTDLQIGATIYVSSGFASTTQIVSNISGTDVTVGNNATSSVPSATISWMHATTGTVEDGSRIITDVANPANITVGSRLIVSSGFASTSQTVVSVDGTSVAVGNKATSSGSGKCIQINGTSGGNLLIDNDIVWEMNNVTASSVTGRPLTSTDIGLWKQLVVSNFVPNNATSALVNLYQYVASSAGTNSMVYWAEPCLMAGFQVPMAVIQGVDEHSNGVVLGGNQISFDAYIPSNASSKLYSKYAKYGDVCWNDGSVTALTSGNPSYWRCTTAGINGSGGAWTAVNIP